MELPESVKEWEISEEYAAINKNELEFRTARHIVYFKMCLNLLPPSVQSQDSNKLSIVYFCLVAIDLLNKLNPIVYKTEEDRQKIIEWVYTYYMGAGFRGSINHSFGENSYKHPSYDPPHLPSTYFGLCVLSTLGDATISQRINRFEIMSYLKKCQLPDGSITTILDINGNPFGEHDLRTAFMATCIRKMLQIDKATAEERAKYDINIDSLEKYIHSCESYEGGFGGEPFAEVHSGHTFCGLGALKLLDRLDMNTVEAKYNKTIEWLSGRQFWLNKYNSEEFNGNELLGYEDLGGMNGRENKYSDTCYAFWVLGSLNFLGKKDIVHKPALEYFLLKVTQNRLIGGFSKSFGETPDPMHSSLGMAALKLMGSEYTKDLKNLNMDIVVSESAKNLLYNLQW